MNIESKTPVKIADKDSSSAEIAFTLIPQSPNDDGFVDRFLTENVAVEAVHWDKRDGVNEEGKGRLAARFRVVVEKKASPKTTKKKAPAKLADAE